MVKSAGANVCDTSKRHSHLLARSTLSRSIARILFSLLARLFQLIGLRLKSLRSSMRSEKENEEDNGSARAKRFVLLFVVAVVAPFVWASRHSGRPKADRESQND